MSSKVPVFAFRCTGFAVTAKAGFSLPRAPRRALALLCAICAAFIALAPLYAAESYSADAVKAEFLHRFAGYVEWPAELPADAPFTIAVVGADGVFAELTRLMPGRTIQNHPVEIHSVSAVRDLEHVQILYLPPHVKGSARALLAAAIGRPILVVSDEEGGLAIGSTVNFVQAERHVRFEISLVGAERSRLSLSPACLNHVVLLAAETSFITRRLRA